MPSILSHIRNAAEELLNDGQSNDWPGVCVGTKTPANVNYSLAEYEGSYLLHVRAFIAGTLITAERRINRKVYPSDILSITKEVA
jgi:hypothetical protein